MNEETLNFQSNLTPLVSKLCLIFDTKKIMDNIKLADPIDFQVFVFCKSSWLTHFFVPLTSLAK